MTAPPWSISAHHQTVTFSRNGVQMNFRNPNFFFRYFILALLASVLYFQSKLYDTRLANRAAIGQADTLTVGQLGKLADSLTR